MLQIQASESTVHKRVFETVGKGKFVICSSGVTYNDTTAMSAYKYKHTHTYIHTYIHEGLPKISENLLVIT